MMELLSVSINCKPRSKNFPSPVLSVRFEVGVSFLLALAGADKRGPRSLFV